MTTTTDLLRRAAEMLREWDEQTGGCDHKVGICNCDWRQTAKDLLALADQMERAEPVAWVTPLQWGKFQSETVEKLVRHKQSQYGFTQPLYTHSAPEVTRDAERLDWLEQVQPIIFCPHEEDGDWVLYPDANSEQSFDGKTLRQAVDIARAAMQEPKP